MEKHGIIAKVTELTDLVNSMVVVHKPNGELRVFLDPTDQNKAIKRPIYPVPTLDDVTSKLLVQGISHSLMPDLVTGRSSYLMNHHTLQLLTPHLYAIILSKNAIWYQFSTRCVPASCR